jgi:hypothetical protein
MNQHSTRRRKLLLAAAALPLAALAQSAGGKKTFVEVWKDPGCGCCKDWVTHLEQNGFVVQVHGDRSDAMRAKLGIPAALASCHTGVAGSYALEGHVPAREIRRLLREKPEALGLAVPGMPVGSPGMDGEVYGGRRDPFDVLLVLKTGGSRVFASYHKA